VNASYAAEHQMVVVDCLEDPDDTLKRKTLDLLFRMTNPQNATVVVDKLTFHMRTSVDTHLRQELVQRITSLAERFAPDNEWYVNTMNTVFELGGDLVPAETAYNLMRLVAEGTGEDEEKDQEFRRFAVNTYLKLLEKSTLSDILVQVIAWVLGEYARLATVDGYTLEDIIDLLCDCIDRPFEDLSTRGYLVNALMKLIGQQNIKSSSVDGIIRNYRSSRLTDLQQRCYEFEQLRQSPGLMQKVLPYDASAEDLTMNRGLTFLDGFVRQKLDEGAKPYQDAYQRASAKEVGGPSQEVAESKPTLNFTPYEAPSKPQAGAFPSAPAGGISGGGPFGGGGSDGGFSSSLGAGASAAQSGSGGLNIAGPRKWGPSGYNNPGGAPAEKPVEKPAPPPVSEPSYSTTAKPAFGASAKAAAAEPPAMTEKQRMAAALFGGIGGNTGAAAPSSAPKPPPPAPAPTPAAAPAPRAPPAPAASAAPAAPPSGGGGGDLLDLLDMDEGGGGGGSSAPARAPAASPGVGGGDDLMLLDMGDGPSPPAPPAPAAPAPAAAPAPILGPLQITTAQVGGTWGSLPAERRVQMTTSCANCQDLMMRFQNFVNAQPVEIIGMEGIAAGRVLPGNDPCFLHGKLAPPRLEVIIRTRDHGVAQRVAQLCQSVLC